MVAAFEVPRRDLRDLNRVQRIRLIVATRDVLNVSGPSASCCVAGGSSSGWQSAVDSGFGRSTVSPGQQCCGADADRLITINVRRTKSACKNIKLAIVGVCRR